MGNHFSQLPIPFADSLTDVYLKYYKELGEWPEIGADSLYDPDYGFTAERPVRVMYATQEEMQNVNIPLLWRDYCSHRLIDYKACQREKSGIPFVHRCAGELHVWRQCQYKDFVLRMKEFEREKRLNRRRIRLEKHGHPPAKGTASNITGKKSQRGQSGLDNIENLMGKD